MKKKQRSAKKQRRQTKKKKIFSTNSKDEHKTIRIMYTNMHLEQNQILPQLE
jgi:hypothetical protein